MAEGTKTAYPSGDQRALAATTGMEKREFIASFALQGLLSLGGSQSPDLVAGLAVEYTDALLLRLAQTRGSSP
jgi:hypothetical protein